MSGERKSHGVYVKTPRIKNKLLTVLSSSQFSNHFSLGSFIALLCPWCFQGRLPVHNVPGLILVPVIDSSVTDATCLGRNQQLHADSDCGSANLLRCLRPNQSHTLDSQGPEKCRLRERCHFFKLLQSEQV